MDTKKASDYTKKMMKELKTMFDGEFKSPMQLSKEDKVKFFKHMDKVWKSKKESSTEEDIKFAKKVQDYFSFMQNQLRENFPKDNYKSPMQIEDKGEKDNFFKQVKKLWKKKKGETKEAATVQEGFFKKFNPDHLAELANALEVAKGHGKMKDKVIHSQLSKALNEALDTSDFNKEEKE